MIRRSVVLKLWLTIVGLVVVVLIILAVYLQQFFYSYVVILQTKNLTDQSVIVSQLLQTDPNYLHNRIANKISIDHTHYYLLRVAEKQTVPLKKFINHLPTTVSDQLLPNSPLVLLGIPSFISNPDPQTNLYSITPIMDSREHLTAYLVITQPKGSTGDHTNTIPTLIAFAVLLGIILTTGLAFVVSKNISRPLIEMNAAAEKLAEGKFNKRVRVMTQDEVGRLGSTFNYVATELEKSMLALTQEKEQMAGILNAMMDIVIATDRNGNSTLLNPSAKQWLRKTRILGQKDKNPNHIIDWPKEFIDLQQSALLARKPIHSELLWQGRDLTVTMTPLYEHNQAAELRGTLAVMRDVTEEKRLDRLRKDFVTNVSHELRTPLTLLQGYTEALLDNFGEDPTQQEELIHIIHGETLRMRRLVNELLDLAQLESANFSMHIEPVDLMVLSRYVLKKFHSAISERGLQLQLDSAQKELFVYGDADRLEQVLTNLIDNALRHTKQGTITLQLEATDEQAVIRIMDTGEGIPEKDLPFVFERFYKADKARIRTGGAGEGTGIGLAIVSSLIRAHHGEIDVQSKVGMGTTFIIILPLLKEADLAKN